MSQLVADLLSRSAATIVGFFLLGAVTLSLMRTVVIPRALRSTISDTVARAVRGIFFTVARIRKAYPKRDAVLAWVGPTTIIAQLITWLLLYLISYSLLIYGFAGPTVREAFRQAGSSLFTLGFSASRNQDQTIVDFVAAATGPIVIALLIGFLPTIYSSYLERENAVTRLASVSGEPAWGPELLCRFAVAGGIDAAAATFSSWAMWSARLRMSHVTYPVLVWVRSVRLSRHYLVALIAVLDAAALHLALNRSARRDEAYEVLIQGGQALDVLYVFNAAGRPWRTNLPLVSRRRERPRIDFESTTHMRRSDRKLIALEIAAATDSVAGLDLEAVTALASGRRRATITRAEFDYAVDVLTRAGYPIEVDHDLAWEEFVLLRSRYEFAAYALTAMVDATPAPWTGPRSLPTETMWPTLVADVIPEVTAQHGDGAEPTPDDAPPSDPSPDDAPPSDPTPPATDAT